jgi:photosystem II stability/assembly factor-like uncharacterized protein
MRVLSTRRLVALWFLFASCSGALAQHNQKLTSMKLLSPQVGWAASDEKLFWTSDGGDSWKDITPRLNHLSQSISAVSFLDPSVGFVLLQCGDGVDPKRDDTCFEFAATSDGGQAWSIVHPVIKDRIPQTDFGDWSGFSGVAFLDFADSQHGWAILKTTSHAGLSDGVMLRTIDGGRTWKQLADGILPMAEQFHFITAKDGWLAGGPDTALYVTHDAGDSWQRVELNRPNSISPELSAVYDLPRFQDRQVGLLAVKYESSTSNEVPLVVFKTEDSGKTWSAQAMLTLRPDTHPWAASPSDVVEGRLLTANVSNGNALDLIEAGPDGEVRNRSAVAAANVYNVDDISFVSTVRGWLRADSVLLSTSDGGSTWVDITPGGRVNSRSEAMPQQNHRPIPPRPRIASHSVGPDMSRDAVPPQSIASTHLGFDAFPTPPLSTMQAWWNSSPYYDIGIYLYGSPNKSTSQSKYPNQAWLSSVQGYGWAVIPIWFGLQSPCVDNKKITAFFSSTPALASTQGAEMADQAVAADQALGITSGIIFTDVENYTVNATCSPAVQAYVDGFVSEIHVYPGYTAGVYANSKPISNDISNPNVATPDEIWIAKTPGKKDSPPQVTIWNLAVDDSLWPNNQRMHQFLIDQPKVTFGGVSMKIDDDINDAGVIGTEGTKPIPGTYSTVNCGGPSTLPYAINDMNGSAFINGQGQIGTIVGQYLDTDLEVHAYVQTGGGSCTIIDYPDAGTTFPFAINNAGTVVGYYETAEQAYLGYLYSGGVPQTLNYPGGGDTYLTGINDAGQITGIADVPLVGNVPFLYYGGTFHVITASGYELNGLANTVATVVSTTGYYSYEELLQPTDWSGTVVNIAQGDGQDLLAQGIDNDNDIVGLFSGPGSCGGYGICSFIVPSGSTTVMVLENPSSPTTQAFGVNDFGQIVGDYLDASSGYQQGLLISQ